MAERYFQDVPPARGHWIRPGTDQASIGREIVGGAYRDYLRRHPEEAGTNTQDAGKKRIEDAYQAHMQRLEDASKGGLSPDAASSYRRDLEPTKDGCPIERAYNAKMRRLEGNQ